MKRAIVAVLLAASAAHADRELHAGLDVRTDLGTHPARLSVGAGTRVWDATLVLDPMYLVDGEHDLDALVEWFPSDRVGLLLGWRWTVIDLASGHHQQQRSLIGITGVGPRFFDGRLRTSASLEFSTLWVSHGGGGDASWFDFDRDFLDRLALGLFVRIEYAR